MARLSLLSAITQCADVLILDEPTNHLDFETVEALANSLKDYKGTIFFTSHDRTFTSLIMPIRLLKLKIKKSLFIREITRLMFIKLNLKR